MTDTATPRFLACPDHEPYVLPGGKVMATCRCRPAPEGVGWPLLATPVSRVLSGSATYDDARSLVVDLVNERLALRTYLYRMFAAVDLADAEIMRLLAGRTDAWELVDQIEKARQSYADYLTGWPDALPAIEAIEASETHREADNDDCTVCGYDEPSHPLYLDGEQPHDFTSDSGSQPRTYTPHDCPEACGTCGFNFREAGLSHCTVCAGVKRLLGLDDNDGGQP